MTLGDCGGERPYAPGVRRHGTYLALLVFALLFALPAAAAGADGSDPAKPTARQWAGRFARGPLPVLALLLTFSSVSALLKARRGIATEPRPFVAGAASLAAMAAAGLVLSLAGGGVPAGLFSSGLLFVLAAALYRAARHLEAGHAPRRQGGSSPPRTGASARR